MNSYVVSDPVDVVEYFNRRSRVAEQDQEVIRLKKRVRILTAGRKVLKSVPGDGNCLVNAFLTSAQIPHTHVQARRNASNWLRENRDTRVQGCDSSARKLVDISAFNDWGAYCDHLAQPAQGAGDVARYGDIGLLVGLSGHYGVSIACITAAPGDHWLIIFNASLLEHPRTVYIAREGQMQEHYHATGDEGLTDQDEVLFRYVRQHQPLPIQLSLALPCGDEDPALHARLLALLDKYKERLEGVLACVVEEGGEGQVERVIEELLEQIGQCRTVAELCPSEVAALFAQTGEGKSFLIDTLLWITAPTPQAYAAGARREEKEAAKRDLLEKAIPALKTAMKRRPALDCEEVMRALQGVRAAAGDYFRAFADPAWQHVMPGYLDASLLEDLESLNPPSTPSDPEADLEVKRAYPSMRRKFITDVNDVLSGLEEAMDRTAPSDVKVVPLADIAPDTTRARAAAADIRSKFSSLLRNPHVGSEKSYLLRSCSTHAATTRASLSITYSPCFALLERYISRADLLTLLAEVADFYHQDSPRYGLPEAEAFRERDGTHGYFYREMYEAVTRMGIPRDGEAVRGPLLSSAAAASGGQRAMGGGGRGFQRFLGETEDRERNARDLRWPQSPRGILLTQEIEAVLQGPRVVLREGSNTDLHTERLAIHDLLHAEQVNDVSRYLVEERHLYCPSSIARTLDIMDVPGFGVEDAGEQHETNKALEEASTIVLPSFKDLKHNQQAVALLEKSRFLSQGRKSATKPGLSLLKTEEGEEKPELETQQVVVISYPENRLAARRSLTDLLNERASRELIRSLDFEDYRNATQHRLFQLVTDREADKAVPIGNAGRQAGGVYCEQNTLCLQFLPAYAAALACMSHKEMQELRAGCGDEESFASRLQRLFNLTGLPQMLALPEHLHARRLTGPTRDLIEAIAKPSVQAPQLPSPRLSEDNDITRKVLSRLRTLYRSLFRSMQNDGRFMEQFERDWTEGPGYSTIQRAFFKMRKRLIDLRTANVELAEKDASAIVSDLRRHLANKRITRGWFRKGASICVEGVDVRAHIFANLPLLSGDGEDFFTANIIAPIGRIIDELVQGFKANLQVRLGGPDMLQDPACGAVLQRLTAAGEDIKQELRGRFKLSALRSFITKHSMRGGIDRKDVDKGAVDAKAHEFNVTRAALLESQLDSRSSESAAFVDLICNEKAVRDCRRRGVERFFEIFLGRRGSRMEDLLTVLTRELQNRAFGIPGGDKHTDTHFRVLFRRMRKALMDVCKANGDSVSTEPAACQPEDRMRQVLEINAGAQSQLEALLAEMGSLDSDPMPPSVQRQLVHHVVRRMREGLEAPVLGRRPRMEELRRNYDPSHNNRHNYLQTLSQSHAQQAAQGAVDARRRPFDATNYGFMSPKAPPAEVVDMDVSGGKGRRKSGGAPNAARRRSSLQAAAETTKPAAGGQAKQGAGNAKVTASEGATLLGAKRKPSPLLEAAANGDSDDAMAFGEERLARLRARLNTAGLAVFERGLIARIQQRLSLLPQADVTPAQMEQARQLLADDQVTFRNGLMSAAAFALRRSLNMRAWNCGWLEELGQELTRMACGAMLDDVAMSDSPDARSRRAALQELLAPVDLLAYVEAVTAGQTGAHPSLLQYVATLFHVDVQIWDGARPEDPPLLLGQGPAHGEGTAGNARPTLNLVFLPPPPFTQEDVESGMRHRYGRWAVALPRQVRKVKRGHAEVGGAQQEQGGGGGGGDEEPSSGQEERRSQPTKKVKAEKTKQVKAEKP